MKHLRWIIPLAIIGVLFFYGMNVYNGVVQRQESVKQAWSNVENQYQRRLDLIPNLVATVKGYASHEKETLEGVVEARSKATQTNVNLENADPATIQKFQESQSQLSSALSRLMVVVEKYPDLKADQNFMQLQAQLEGTENRIATERRRYNDIVREYNVNVRTFPRSLFASMFGFKAYPTFKAEAGANKAPKVDFGN